MPPSPAPRASRPRETRDARSPTSPHTAPQSAPTVPDEDAATAAWTHGFKVPRPPPSRARRPADPDATETAEAEDQLFRPSARDPRIGTRIGTYEVVRQLARGGMGMVYLGRHRRLGRKVAIKFPHAHVLGDADLSRRFLSEAMAAVQIAHPGVVNVFDYGHAADGAPYLVMELLEGASLGERMADGPLPIDLALRVAARVADTLAAAHESGVIHRDLKPENVFLQRQRHRPDRLTVKVLDFGFAKLVGGPFAGGIAPLTQQGLVLGTPSYMSPEQCLGFAPVDHRTDIYSLGCLLYEMVAGRLPFTGGLAEVKLALRYRPAVPPRWHNREVPQELEDLIMRLLSKRPGDRLPHMLDVSHALERIAVARASRQRASTADLAPPASASIIGRGRRTPTAPVL